ncbi:MAG TPA: ABC transporter substrate-binding protein [Pseudobdellovibrionaceae bacterium]|nr:ABC transporter substrate-binding protein [Pseudobdellovibrionaceae bacterium]
MAASNSKSIHTYMSYGLPIDPSNVRTLVDLDLSYALGATLTEWSDSRELVSGIAKSWEFSGKNEISFKLRDGLKWSDGESVTASQVVASLNRAKKLHGESLKSLFEQIRELSAPEKNLVKLLLVTDAANSGVLAKLTEPMYGLLYIKENGDLDLSKTVGPFKLVKASEELIEMGQNANWFKYNPKMAEKVLIKRPPTGEEVQGRFAKDEWVNLMTSSSLVEQSVNDLFIKHHFSVWNRSLDKIFFLSPGPKTTNDEGRELFKYLNKSLDRSTLTSGLSGFNLTQQFFPAGYVLFDPEFKKSLNQASLPKAFQNRPIKILGVSSRLNVRLKENLKIAVRKATGNDPEFKLVQLNEFESARAANDYDFLAGALPVNDPNVEGAMGFFFGLSPSIIPDAGSDRLAFGSRVSKAKLLSNQSDRNGEYRRIFSEATIHGSIVPLFHYSTVVIAKTGMDLSLVPMSDETVAFSKVRFK